LRQNNLQYLAGLVRATIKSKEKPMFIAIILFGIIISYIVFHAFVYFSILHFFGITSGVFKIILMIAFVFLAVSFFISTFLSHFQDNVFTRIYYFFAGLWIGFLTNLVLFFVLAWVIVFANSKMHIIANQKIIGGVAILASILYLIYGIWNAFTPMVTKINVSIGNLPDAWKGKKIVQISDVHLGHIFNASFMKDAAQKINALGPDIVVITGDLFDGTDGSLDSFTDSLNSINAPDGIYYVTGNHETYLGVEKVEAVLSKTKITMLQDEMRNVNGLQIVGINYPERMQSKNIGEIIKNMNGFDSKKPSILLWHAPTQIENAKNAGISLQLSGHTHKGQLFPFRFITALVYKGYDYGYKKEGSFSIYTSSGLGGWGPPMRTEKRSEIVEITLK
jgi:predicted MPP superfamily phosphohydrolase